jgi:hypothetical protein
MKLSETTFIAILVAIHVRTNLLQERRNTTPREDAKGLEYYDARLAEMVRAEREFRDAHAAESRSFTASLGAGGTRS